MIGVEPSKTHISTTELDSFMLRYIYNHVNIDNLVFIPKGLHNLATKPKKYIDGSTLDERLSLYQSLGGKWYLILCDEDDLSDAEWEHIFKDDQTEKEAKVSVGIIEKHQIKIIGSRQTMLEKYAKRLDFAGDIIEYYKNLKKQVFNQIQEQQYIADNMFALQSITASIVKFFNRKKHEVFNLNNTETMLILTLFSANKMMNKKELADRNGVSARYAEDVMLKLDADGYVVTADAEHGLGNSSSKNIVKRFGLTAKGIETVFKIMESLV